MIITFVSFFLFLFVSYFLSKDDFMLIRKNVTVEQVFNTIFLSLPFVLLISRSVYVLVHLNKIYLNPLVFLALPYFPGLSLSAGLIASLLFLFWYAKRKKFPTQRLLDIFSVAFTYSWCGGLLVVIVEELLSHMNIFREVIVTLLLLPIAISMTHVFLKGKWKEGRVGYSILAITSLLFIIWLGLGFVFGKHIPLIGDVIVLCILFCTEIISWLLQRFSKSF